MARKTARCLKYLNNFQTAIKTAYLDGKMEDESIDESMLQVTVAEAKNQIKLKRFISLIYKNIFKVSYVNELTKAEFTAFGKHISNKLTEHELGELFNHLIGKKDDPKENKNPWLKDKKKKAKGGKSYNEWGETESDSDDYNEDGQRSNVFGSSSKPLDVMKMEVLEIAFEKFFSSEDSVALFANTKF